MISIFFRTAIRAMLDQYIPYRGAIAATALLLPVPARGETSNTAVHPILLIVYR